MADNTPYYFACVLAVGLSTFGIVTYAQNRQFERDVRIASDVVRACGSSEESSCRKARLTAAFGPKVLKGDLEFRELCRARRSDPAVASKDFIGRCDRVESSLQRRQDMVATAMSAR